MIDSKYLHKLKKNPIVFQTFCRITSIIDFISIMDKRLVCFRRKLNRSVSNLILKVRLLKRVISGGVDWAPFEMGFNFIDIVYLMCVSNIPSVRPEITYFKRRIFFLVIPNMPPSLNWVNWLCLQEEYWRSSIMKKEEF